MKFNQQFENIVSDRLAKENNELSADISRKLQEMADRGIYPSGFTVKDVLEIIIGNIEKVKETICSTAIEIHKAYYPNENAESLTSAALDILEKQKHTFLLKRSSSVSEILKELKLDQNTGVAEIEQGFATIESEVKLSIATYFSGLSKEKNAVENIIHNLNNNKTFAPFIVIAKILIGFGALYGAYLLLANRG